MKQDPEQSAAESRDRMVAPCRTLLMSFLGCLGETDATSQFDQNGSVAGGCDLQLAIRYEAPKVANDTLFESATCDGGCPSQSTTRFALSGISWC